MKTSDQKKMYLTGVTEIVLANFFVGINVILNKYLVHHFPLFLLLELRYFFGMLLLVLICLFTKDKFKFYRTEETFSFQDSVTYFFMATSGGMLFNCIYMVGLNHTTAMATGIISSSIPTLVAIFSYFLLKQDLKRVHLFCIALVVVGILILNGSKESAREVSRPQNLVWFGNAIVFLAMIPEALFTIFAKKLKVPVFPIMSALVINAINFLLCAPMAFYQIYDFGFENITKRAWFFSFLIGLFSGVFFYIFYNRGIAKIDSSTAALLTGAVPVSTALFAVIFLNESVNVNMILGMICVLISIYIGVRFGRR